MRWIGIDFGTTNSAAAILEQGKVRETLGTLGRDREAPVPSLVSCFQDDYHFGFQALEDSLGENSDWLIVSDLKPLLGRSHDVRVGRGTFKVEALTTHFLEHLLNLLKVRETSKEELGAVIATPVEFPPEHRHALHRAALKAGIGETLFVYEPTAALFQSLHGKSFPDGPVAVIDWGGGTVDITVVRCHPDGKIEDLNVNARRKGLGGRDLDKAILESILCQNPEASEWYAGASRSVQNSILNRLERLKIEFLGGKSPTIVDFFHPTTPAEYYSSFRFDEAIAIRELQRFTSEVRRLALETTRDAGLAVEDVTAFLLVGGPLRSPLVRQTVGTIWPLAEELSVAHHQRATVQGCARLANQGFDLALAADIVVRQFDDSYHEVLLRNQPLPREKGTERIREFYYRLIDLSAPQAVIELGYLTEAKGYVPLEVLSVPVMHHRNPDTRSVIPFNVRLTVGLDEYLYVMARLKGRMMLHSDGRFQDIEQKVGLSRIPLTLIPRNGRSES
jgi:molecular chaperone DnaK (HSP70)